MRRLANCLVGVYVFIHLASRNLRLHLCLAEAWFQCSSIVFSPDQLFNYSALNQWQSYMFDTCIFQVNNAGQGQKKRRLSVREAPVVCVELNSQWVWSSEVDTFFAVRTYIQSVFVFCCSSGKGGCNMPAWSSKSICSEEEDCQHRNHEIHDKVHILQLKLAAGQFSDAGWLRGQNCLGWWVGGRYGQT